MAADTLADAAFNSFERAQRLSELQTGRRATLDEMAENFALYPANNRADLLLDMDAELKLAAPTDDNESALRSYAERIGLRRRLGAIHDELRQIGR